MTLLRIVLLAVCAALGALAPVALAAATVATAKKVFVVFISFRPPIDLEAARSHARGLDAMTEPRGGANRRRTGRSGDERWARDEEDLSGARRSVSPRSAPGRGLGVLERPGRLCHALKRLGDRPLALQ